MKNEKFFIEAHRDVFSTRQSKGIILIVTNGFETKESVFTHDRVKRFSALWKLD